MRDWKNGMLAVAAMLLAGCSLDDVTLWTDATTGTAAESMPITFSCSADSGTPATRAGQAGDFAADSRLLCYTGFGLFTYNEGAPQFDVMYNQQVEYHFLADDDAGDDANANKNGYWTYYPLKYWPATSAGICSLYFCAYAPYVATADPAGTGITGLAPNSSNTPYVDYTCAMRLENNVDLMWGCKRVGEVEAMSQRLKPLKLTMHHALARIAVSVALTKAEPSIVPDGAKVLVESVELSGAMAKSGRLSLNVANDKPEWTNLVTEARTVTIDNEGSDWGIVDEQVRYVRGLPYNWQPQGLQAGKQPNVLSHEGHKAFLYLIPQSGLELSTKITCVVMEADGTETTVVRRGSCSLTLTGNTPYVLALTINI